MFKMQIDNYNLRKYVTTKYNEILRKMDLQFKTLI